MPEILTESFCERCGTRYTFESAAPTRAKKLGRFKTISKGLKNYVLSDDSSMDEAMAAARSDEEREVTSHQLDAFHATFNFCMTCRQYTCGNCWNQAEGSCLTCAPHLGHEIMPAPFPDLTPMHGEPVHVDATAWPTSDLATDSPDVLAPAPDLEEILAINRLARISESQPGEAVPPEMAPAVEAEADPAGAWPIATEPGLEAAASIEAVPDTDEAALAEADSFAEPVADAEVLPVEAVAAQPAIEEPPAGVHERAAAATLRTAALLAKFRPGQNIDAELAAYEASVGPEPAVEAPTTEGVAEPIEAAAEPIAAEPAGVEPAIVAAVLAAPEPEPEPVAAREKRAAAAAALAAASAAAARVERAPEPELVAAFDTAAPVEEPVAVEAAAPVEEVPAEIATEAPDERAAAAAALAAAAAAAARVEPEREPTAPPPAPEPVRADLVEQPTWRIVAPDAPAVPTNGHDQADQGLPAAASASPLPPAPPAPPAPEWPANPQWPVAAPNAALLATRQTSTSAANDALWAASARDVVAHPQGAPGGGVQSCSSCGLSLSATARFCRRCGSRQGG